METNQLNVSRKNYVKSLLTIAVPIMLGNIISQVQMLVDKAFLGHVNEFYLSALGNVSSPMWTSMSFCFTIVTGSSIIISQLVGAKKTEECESYAASLMLWTSVLPVILFFFWLFAGRYVLKAMGVTDNMMPICLEYLRYFSPVVLVIGIESSSMVIMQTSNYTKPLVAFGLIRSLLNVVLDYIMIFGKFGCPAMGIKGAAIATSISEYVGVSYSLLIFVRSKKLFTRPKLKNVLRASPVPFLKSVKIGINAALEDFSWNLGNLILIAILNSISEKAAGIFSMIFGIELLVVVVIGAIGNATMTLSGEAIGAKDQRKYKYVCLISLGLCFAVSFALLIVCAVFPHQIVGIFTNDQSVISTSTLYLMLMCINLFGKSGNIIAGNSIRGSGNTLWMLITQIFGSVEVILVALLFVKVFNWGIAGVFAAVLFDEFLRAGINFLKFCSIVRKI